MSRRVGGRYRLVEALGGGGTSVVYRAEMAGGLPDVAVKELRPQFAADPTLRRRFLREAELARTLDHPGVVRVLDTGEEAGVPFIVMELARGRTLRQHIDQDGRLEYERARSIFNWLAAALDHAHRRGIIHRDVKPENIFITGVQVKLGDFGNARVVSLASVTGASLTWGTPEYVAPEVFMRGRADPRSDLYSLGAVMYEMLTGRLPWSRSETLARLAGGSASAKAPAPAGASEAIDSLLSQLLAFSPADRPASADEILTRVSYPTAVVVAAKCSACGAARPGDIPRCLSCGHEALRVAHDAKGRWQLVLEELDDDPGATERLLRLLDPIAAPPEGPLQFITGARNLYSDAELNKAISLPAVLFSELDGATARSLESLFRREGLAVRAHEGGSIGRTIHSALATITPRRLVTFVGGFAPLAVMLTFVKVGWVFPASLFGGMLLLAIGGGWYTVRKKRRRPGYRLGVFSFREEIATGPVADAVLAGAAGTLEAVGAPEVRALLGDVASEIYRLTRRVEQLGAKSPPASSELDLLRRTAAAAPALLERLRRMAARLDDLDTALKGQSEGELMQAMSRLERAAAAPGSDRAALGASRRDLEATLERRHATEQERARLSANLCRLLGHLRGVYRQALAMKTPAEHQAVALEAASAELDAALAAPATG